MANKLLIHKLKNNAELAWVAYGYYDLMTSDTNQLFLVLKDKKGKDRTDSNGNPITQEINLIDIMDSYAKYNVVGKDKWGKDFEKVGTLNGDFTPTQAKNFFEKYDLLDFYPKFDTKNNRQIQGFHACLFQDKESKEYTLVIRGSLDSNDDTTDFFHLFKDSTIPFDYLHTMILFYESCAKKYLEITQPKSLNVVGYSLGGSLSQIFTLAFSDNTNQDSIISEVYIFNSPGANNLKPHIVLDSKQIYEVDESIIRDFNPAHAMFFKITNKDPNANWLENLKRAISQEQNILSALRIYFSKIPSNELKPHRIFLHSYIVNAGKTHTILYQVYPIRDTFIQAYQTLIHNYSNRNEKDYKLDISDKVLHIESKNQADKYHHAKESYKENAAQHLGKDIEGNYFNPESQLWGIGFS